MHPHPEPPLEATDRALERFVLEGAETPTRIAEQVMMMVAARDDGLVAGGAVAHLDPLHDPDRLEGVERAVNARDPDSLPRLAQARVDLLRGHAAVLAGKLGDDRPPGAPGAVTGFAECAQRQVGPLPRSRVTVSGVFVTGLDSGTRHRRQHIA